MAGLDPAIHLTTVQLSGMDGRLKGGHDKKGYPNRPVMYCSVLLLSGAVKIFSVAPYSTNSPKYMKAV